MYQQSYMIELLSINKLELINKILGEDEIIDQNEFNIISNHYEEFHNLKIYIQIKKKVILIKCWIKLLISLQYWLSF